MSDEGEKNCPLCAEEMDLTDQQLKPCKCGYEICVWCWHHLMDMAEKDGTEGRCPACRTPYNKEKIVGMASSCERIVAGMNVERKGKLQKAKSKPSEGRKHLTSVRVIQRNLVYIVGLPLNLADEDLLERREYFCQYGKVLKVSISRTAAGSIQQFANNTCSVYITYSKEEDAVRCIQSVHGFVLDGSCLRACFGTTKYCRAWLRNMPCSNPECLYLHEIGTQEDSFTKDEIISAYTRSRVQQITGATINMQRRSGNVLPPPADEHCTNGSATSEKPITKSASNNPATSVRSSPPNSSSSRSAPLPSTAAAAASWGPHASNCHQPPTSLVCANGPSKQKPETCSVSTAIASTTRVPLLNDDVQRKLIPCEEGQTILRRGKQEALEPDTQVGIAPTTASVGLPVMSTLTGQLHNLSASEDKDRRISAASPIINSFELSGRSNSHVSDKDQNVSPNGNVQNVWSDMAKLKSDHLGSQYSGDTSPNSSHADKGTLGSDQISNSVAREDSDWRSYTHAQVANTDSQVAFPEVEEDSQYFEDQRLKDPEVLSRTRYLPNSSTSFIISNPSGFYSPQQTEPYGSTSFNVNTQTLDKKFDKGSILHPSGVPRVPNGFPEDIVSTSVHSDRTVDDLYLLPLDLKKKHVGRFECEAVNADQNTSIGNGESSIISNILSMDFDSWDESLTSPQTLAKLLGENERRQGSLKLSSSWKVQNSNQSRFSFARQEECRNQISGGEPSFSNAGQLLKDRPLSHNFPESRYFNFDKHGDSNGFSTSNFEESDNFSSSHSPTSNKLFVSRAQMSVPPGFSVPSRAPPPGFTTQGRVEPTFDTISGNHFLDPSSLLRNTYQVPPTENISGDIEFMDPAILAVGKERFPAGLNNAAGVEMRPNYPSQLDAFENEASPQLFMQRSLPPLQNPGFSDVANGFSPVSDAYRTPSRMMEQTQTHNPSLFPQLSLQQSRTALMSDGQWGSWNDVHSGNDRGMADLLRTEILGPNKLYTGYEDSKFRMPSSGDLYNRMYGI